MRHPRPESLACGQAPYPEGLTPGPASNDRSNATGIHQCRVVDARESMTVPHAHTEGGRAPVAAAGAHHAAVIRFPTEGRSMSEQPLARAVAGQRAAGGRRSARPGVAPGHSEPPKFTAGAPTGGNG